MNEFIKDLESYEELETLLEILENVKKERLYTKFFDDCVSEFLTIASNNSYDHGIIDNDEELENYFKRTSDSHTTSFKQGQDIEDFNAEYFYINGYDNLEDLSSRRLDAETSDLLDEVIEVLQDEIIDHIEEHFEDSKEPLKLLDNRLVKYNGVNYSIEEGGKLVVYGAEVKNIMVVLIATLKCNITRELHNKKPLF